ncbi:hypothetical protein [Fodinibius halophilus]|uniref:Uncharacterized protein n=1 Tax=Fodinibius halophilus TaxID=1736908 RepID=A0A6M1TJD4_9BACT|nr:hypothetical protein [Fodinibius halophilus]NGP88710.1 hypothetical protein [Fodinibius halophilus]
MAITEDDLQSIFEAEKTEATPSQDELEFLEERARIESDTLPLLSIDQYEEQHALFCRYGLEKQMLERTEPHIRYLSRFKPGELLASSFYKQFRDKKIVRQYVEENIDLVNSENK